MKESFCNKNAQGILGGLTLVALAWSGFAWCTASLFVKIVVSCAFIGGHILVAVFGVGEVQRIRSSSWIHASLLGASQLTLLAGDLLIIRINYTSSSGLFSLFYYTLSLTGGMSAIALTFHMDIFNRNYIKSLLPDVCVCGGIFCWMLGQVLLLSAMRGSFKTYNSTAMGFAFGQWLPAIGLILAVWGGFSTLADRSGEEDESSRAVVVTAAKTMITNYGAAGPAMA